MVNNLLETIFNIYCISGSTSRMILTWDFKSMKEENN